MKTSLTNERLIEVKENGATAEKEGEKTKYIISALYLTMTVTIKNLLLSTTTC
jgi:hypothetical protein